MDDPNPTPAGKDAAATPRRNIAEDATAYAADDRAGAGGTPDSGPGDAGGTLGTGGASEEDQ